MGWWSQIFEKEAQNWFYSEMAAEQTPNDIEIKEVQPRQEYISIDLKSMRITKVRKGFSKFYAAVNSFISLDHVSGKSAEFNVITTPGKLKELAPSDLEKIIFLNQPLLGPIPYVGGNVEMQIGLFSLKSSDLTLPFLTLLTDMSQLAGISFISVALPYAKTLKSGIDLITGSQQNTSLEVGLSSTYRKVKTGYYVAAGVAANEVDESNLVIDKSYRLVNKQGKEITQFPYIIFQISSSPRRTDYFTIPELVAAHKQLQDAIRQVKTRQEANAEIISAALFNFQKVVLTCSDLIPADADKIFEEIEADTTKVIESLKGKSARPATAARSVKPQSGQTGKYLTGKSAMNRPAVISKSSTKDSVVSPVKLRSLKQLNIYKNKK